MREAARFLETFGDILDIATVEGMASDGLPLLLEAARKDVETVRLADPGAVFELGDGDVFWRGRPLAGTVEWPWRERLVEARVVELSPPSDESAFQTWVARIVGKLTPAEPDQTPVTDGSTDPAVDASRDGTDPADPRPPRVTALPPEPAPPTASAPPTVPTVHPDGAAAVSDAAPTGPPPSPTPDAIPLDEEAERVWWLYGEAANHGQVPRRESEELLIELSRKLDRGAARATGRELDDTGEIATPHLINVAMMAMGVGRHLAFDDDEIRALGLAGLYHDVGRVRTEGGRPDDLRQHPTAGAKVLMDSGSWFAVAAVVAYEHHLSWRGTGGYPQLHFARAPHQFTRIVTVCDTFDALRTERAQRPALTVNAACEYLRMLAGKTLDPEIVTGVVGYAGTAFTHVEHPRTRAEARLADVRWLPDNGFDPDQEPRPISI